jgi:hypothetical protein
MWMSFCGWLRKRDVERGEIIVMNIKISAFGVTPVALTTHA